MELHRSHLLTGLFRCHSAQKQRMEYQLRNGCVAVDIGRILLIGKVSTQRIAALVLNAPLQIDVLHLIICQRLNLFVQLQGDRERIFFTYEKIGPIQFGGIFPAVQIHTLGSGGRKAAAFDEEVADIRILRIQSNVDIINRPQFKGIADQVGNGQGSIIVLASPPMLHIPLNGPAEEDVVLIVSAFVNDLTDNPLIAGSLQGIPVLLQNLKTQFAIAGT